MFNSLESIIKDFNKMSTRLSKFINDTGKEILKDKKEIKNRQTYILSNQLRVEKARRIQDNINDFIK